MKYVGYELRKLVGKRYLWIFAALLLCLNSVTAFLFASEAGKKQLPAREMDAFYKSYFNAPEQMDEYFARMSAFEEAQSELMADAMQRGNYSFTPDTWQNKYATEGFRDRDFFEALYSSIRSAGQYAADMQRVIDRAQLNLDELDALGVAADSYAYRYQQKVLRTYEKLRDNVHIDSEYSHGWNELLSYDTVNLFIFAVVIMFSSVVFVGESKSGMLDIIGPTRRGGAASALPKFLTMALVSCVVAVLFSLTSLAVIGAVSGFSSPANAIQSVADFKFCPLTVSVGGYFALVLLIRIVACITLACILTALSIVFCSYIAVYVTGVAIVGANVLLGSLNYVNADALPKFLNLWSVCSGKSGLTRFRAVNLFGLAIWQLSFMLVVLGGVCLLATGFGMWRFCARRHGGRRLPLTGKALALQRRASARHSTHTEKRQTYPTRLFAHELFKLFIPSRLIILIIVLFIGKTVFAAYTFSAPATSYDAAYRQYMTYLEGTPTDEKRQYIVDERRYIDSTLAACDAKRAAYVSHTLSAEDYRAYLAEYNYAVHHDSALSDVERIAARISVENGGQFVYDSGWSTLFESEVDIFLVSAIILLFSGLFADEFSDRLSSGTFSALLRTTARGRRDTHTAKFLLCICVSATLAAAFEMVDVMFVCANYLLPAPDAPLLSLTCFADTAGGITIGGYLALMLVGRIAACVIMACIVTGLSGIIQKRLSCTIAATTWIVVPAVLSSLGVGAAKCLDFLAFESFTLLWQRLHGSASDRATAITLVVASICACVAAVVASGRRFGTEEKSFHGKVYIKFIES